MSKRVFIAEKPSVAKEFGKALHESFANKDGYMESDKSIVTWCVGHLVTMSYPEKYDENLKKWRLDSIPFIPESFKYEVIPSVKKQFDIVKYLLTREDVSQIYVCTDSGREGEYIYRLVRQEADVKGKMSAGFGLIHRQRKKFIRELKMLSLYLPMIIFQMLLIFEPRKIILLVSISQEFYL